MQSQSSFVRLGVIGVGGLGGRHARAIATGSIPRATLGAVCDVNPAFCEKFPGIPAFTDFEEMLNSGLIDAVVIATPPYFHTNQSIQALMRNIPVLTEGPIAVHKADAERMLEAWDVYKPVFAAMFDMRTVPVFKKLRQLLHDGTFGQFRRATWIITDNFRSEAYYNSANWRATWGGEGGGILVNQCPQNLDMFLWLFGMPTSVQALCKFGKYHDIEVEDEFHAVFDFADNATGTIIATTGEAPGTDRLEIATEYGRILVEKEKILWTRTEYPVTEYSRSTRERTAPPPIWEVMIPAPGAGGRHDEVLRNFVNAILDETPLIASAHEGLYAVELANAILYSSHYRCTFDFPLDSAGYEEFLAGKIAASRFRFNEDAKRTQFALR